MRRDDAFATKMRGDPASPKCLQNVVYKTPRRAYGLDMLIS